MKFLPILLASLISGFAFAGGSMGGGNPSYVKTIHIDAEDFHAMLSEIFSSKGSQLYVSDDVGVLKPERVDLCKRTIVLRTQDGDFVLVRGDGEDVDEDGEF